MILHMAQIGYNHVTSMNTTKIDCDCRGSCSEISPIIKEKAPLILAEIKKAGNILLHCHPSPDPDSVGSALAMKFALAQLGKKATVIKGDSNIPQAFMHFPGANEIIAKNFLEVDLKEFDLFIALDSSSLRMISDRGPVEFPKTLKVLVIDHHRTNTGYGAINLVEPSYPAACQMLFDLFQEWGIVMDSNIAPNLFIGIYTDTMFKYDGVTPRTFEVAAELVRHINDLSGLIGKMENSRTPAALSFIGLGLSNIQVFLEGKMAISGVSNSELKTKSISDDEAGPSEISSLLRTVMDWEIGAALIEIHPHIIRASFRTQDFDKYDVSKLAVVFGGGGHKGAAGATLNMSLGEAKKLVVAKAKELYNL